MLLIGPPGSGKTTRVLAELEAALASGERARLIVPTSSMATHLLHEMARRAGAVAGRPVLSIADFVESLTPQCSELSPASRILLAGHALRNASEFGVVSTYPGFHHRFLEAVEEFWAAGKSGRDVARLPAGPFGRPFAAAMTEYEQLLVKAGAVHRAERLRLAAAALAATNPGPLFFDGFFNFTPVELELLRAAREVIVTLPAALPGLDLPETRLEHVWRPTPAPVVIRAPSPEREIEDIAGRLLRDHDETGRSFHQYGIILRSPEVYEPILAVVFERFGIPFRSRPQTPPQICGGVLEDRVPPATVLQWRGLAQAQRASELAQAEAAQLSRLMGTPLAETLEAVLRLTECRAPDRRRNVVQVLSVYEARQWELPVVFVCGLVERQFPRHHGQNLLFSDGVRQRLEMLGVRLRTSEEKEAEERFLFELACTRATEQLYVTYPAHSESGGETLRSFFLAGDAAGDIPARAVRVREPRPAWQPNPGRLTDPALLEALAQRHERFAPTALERYVQCPFLFFAERTLRLQGPPPDPEDLVTDALWQGTIIHRTIARWAGAVGGPIGPVFETVFAEMCALEGVQLNFRAEARKMALAADLERFAAAELERPRPAGFRPGAPETSFEYTVEEGIERPFRVTGRIDRYDVSDDGAVVVVDYKYSAKQRIQRLWEEHVDGVRVQAPLYLLGLERQRGLRPAGMVLYGLRNEPSRKGWLLAGSAAADAELDLRPAEEFRALLDRAEQTTLKIVGEIRSGHVEVKPRERLVCREFCAYRKVCRIIV
jgi:ATP-dependent helicase/DNAse subunit B